MEFVSNPRGAGQHDDCQRYQRVVLRWEFALEYLDEAAVETPAVGRAFTLRIKRN